MTQNMITLTGEHLAQLRDEGRTYTETDGRRVRILLASHGYRPIAECANEVLLTDTALDAIQTDPEGLSVADTLGKVTWRITVESGAGAESQR